MPFAAASCSVVSPQLYAIRNRLLPDFTVYVPEQACACEVAGGTGVAPGVGMFNFWPGLIKFGLMPGLTATMADGSTLQSRAIL